MQEIMSNIVQPEKYKSIIKQVVNSIESVVATTVGPYGVLVQVDDGISIFSTKDGWNILKNLTFNESIHNSIYRQLMETSHHIVTKTGDGTTSAFIVTSELFRTILATDFNGKQQKEVLDTFKKCVDDITPKIIPTKVEFEDRETLMSLALVAANHDVEMATMVVDAVQKSGDGGVILKESTTLDTYMEVESGYSTPGTSLLDADYYTTNQGANLLNPIIIYCNFGLNQSHIAGLNAMYHEVIVNTNSNRQMVVVGAGFDEDAMAFFNHHKMRNAEQQRSPQIIPLHMNMTIMENRTNIYDLSVLSGSYVMEHTDWKRLFEVGVAPIKDGNGNVTERNAIIGSFEEEIHNYIGTCDKMTATTKTTRLSGFNSTDEVRLGKLKNELNVALEEELALGELMLNNNNAKVLPLRKRIRRLLCDMVTLHVGGDSDQSRKARYDAYEDSVRATATAVSDGYVIGGGYSVPMVCEKLLAEEGITEIETLCLSAIRDAFLAISGWIFNNAGKTDFDPKEELKLVMEHGTILDVLTGSRTSDIINPVSTDIEILRHTVSLVSILATSSMLVSVKPREQI